MKIFLSILLYLPLAMRPAGLSYGLPPCAGTVVDQLTERNDAGTLYIDYCRAPYTRTADDALLVTLRADQQIRIEAGEPLTESCNPVNDQHHPPGYVAMDIDDTLNLCNLEVVDMTSSSVVVDVRGVRMSHPLGEE